MDLCLGLLESILCILTLFHESIVQRVSSLGLQWLVLVDKDGLQDGFIKSEEVLGAASNLLMVVVMAA
jgi:hypothetical protein